MEIDGVSATRSNWLWSSDPRIVTKIAFTGIHYAAGGPDGIYVAGTDGKAPTRLPTASSILNGYPSWFPDDSAVTVEGSNPPFIVLVGVPDGTLLQTETSTAQLLTGQSAISRDGTQLAFAAQVPQAGSQYDDDHNQIRIRRLIPANQPGSV